MRSSSFSLSSFGLLAALGSWPFMAATSLNDVATSGPRSEQVLGHVNAAMKWYRQSQNGAQWVGEPSDRIYFDGEHALANRVLQLAFSSAQADALALPSPPAAGKTDAANQKLLASQAEAATRVSQLQGKIADLDRQIQAAGPDNSALLQTQRDELAAELDLAKTTHDSINQVASFVAIQGDSSSSLTDQIAELQRSVPEAFAQGDAAKVPELKSIGSGGSGLIGRGEAFYALFKAVRGVEVLDHETLELEGIVTGLRKPLGDSIRTIIQQGKAATDQAATPETSADPGKLDALRGNFQDLASKFRDLAGAAVPLRQEQLLLEQSHQNLAVWRASLQRQYTVIIRSLLWKVLSLGLVIALMLGLSDIWRRATFRYVHDLRRRRQFLLIRRFTTSIILVLVVIFTFVSDYSSLATYAGFLTAGVAVALQTVIVSVAAYFLLIGRYGVRVGDRLTVSGVTGTVIDIGLVRFYMTELAGTGVELHPTGRVAVFANSVLFQPTPIYRQLPGTDYTWHEAVVPLVATADFPYLTGKLLAAATKVYTEYRPSLEKQHGEIERLIDLKLEVPEPASQLRYSAAGVELVIRYPVEIAHVAVTDNLMASAILEAIRGDNQIKDATTAMPRIQAAVKV